jgi:glycerol-1-phosphate dehydrogenase [NAD(P)+]
MHDFKLLRELSMTDWNDLIRDVIAGTWRDPQTGLAAKMPFETIRIEDDLDGGAADVVAPLKIGRRLVVVSDDNTYDAMAQRVIKELQALGAVDELVMPSDTHCDEPTIGMLQDKTRHADGLVVVGSGSLSDVVKYATFKDGRKYVSFPTAASMNGYAAGTASVTLGNGYKTSLPAHAPRGIFIDLKVNAAAPTWLSAAGLADSMCRPTAQVDWWASHRLLGTSYSNTPYALIQQDEPRMIATAAGIVSHDADAIGHLHRVMILTGFGNCFTGSSHSGSMGEHQVSHWIDMFAGKNHPGTIHGQQVGVATLAIARLHQQILHLAKPPQIKPTRIEKSDFRRRYGTVLGELCFNEAKKKSFDVKGAAIFNSKLERIWPQLRAELQDFMIDPAAMEATLRSAGGPATATELGLPLSVWRDAMKYGRDIRNRWSFLDLADDCGILDEFLAHDAQ